MGFLRVCKTVASSDLLLPSKGATQLQCATCPISFVTKMMNHDRKLETTARGVDSSTCTGATFSFESRWLVGTRQHRE
eukprot:3020657-Amphidinium_carterae.1